MAGREPVPERRSGRAGRIAAGYLPAVALLGLLLVVWEVWVAVRDTPAYVLPAPSRIGEALVDDRRLLVTHVAVTALEAAGGLLAGAVLGLALALVIASWPLARRVLYPVLVASQTVPMIILAPVLVLWFGFGLAPKLVVVALITFFPVVIATVGGLLGADPELIELVRSMGGGRADTLRHVVAPSAVAAFFDGLRIAATYTVAGAVIAEWTGAEHGLGIYITRSQASFRVDQVFAAVAVVAVLSTALFGLLGVASRLASPWHHPRAESGANP
jgi:ABC-type nitrate/sulfonate/bicarbonate transport system permease component